MSNPLWQILRCCWCLLETPTFFLKELSYSFFFFWNLYAQIVSKIQQVPYDWNICQAHGQEESLDDGLALVKLQSARQRRSDVVTSHVLIRFEIVKSWDIFWRYGFHLMDFVWFCNKRLTMTRNRKEMSLLYMFGDVFIVSCVFFWGDQNSHKSSII